ncbi:MAG: ribonuclease P protein component [Betaproteobacteria bacterium]|nr:ribonuclease P protein component [Betaproteobacteria bacterium]
MSGDRRYRKSQRLDSRAIAQVLASARPRRERNVSVLWRSNGMQVARLGLIVPKRSLSRAVDRNRARRLLREWFRNNQVRFSGQDLLLRVSGRRADLKSLAAELAHLFPGG